ncbi:MAG: hypothetical protein ABWU16_07660 [Halothiobacillaceae bacterium]
MEQEASSLSCQSGQRKRMNTWSVGAWCWHARQASPCRIFDRQDVWGKTIKAGWDLVIIDEAHRLSGSTEQVARYKLGAALAEATPYLLLLSATPHQGKTESVG